MRYQDQSFQQREQSILDAAQQLFQQQAWDRLTIAELAAHAGIGKGTLYKHFPSKEALYVRMVLEFSRKQLQALSELAEQVPAAQRMQRVIRHSFSVMQSEPVLTQLWLHCDRPDFRQRLSEPYRAQLIEQDQLFKQLFLGLLADELSPQQLSEQASIQLLWSLDACFLGVMARIASNSFSFADEPLEVERYLDQVSAFIIAGLHGQTGQPSPLSIKSAL